jgi:hypothetical protein
MVLVDRRSVLAPHLWIWRALPFVFVLIFQVYIYIYMWYWPYFVIILIFHDAACLGHIRQDSTMLARIQPG